MAQLNLRAILLLAAAILILLSATTIAEEGKRCYWCGPLAEQVHRSQRAPSCNKELQETLCEKGFTHCAVIATSPPYAESRMCVKLYQDECYSLYCNSSKTWRMICPCKGDLCNGRNTDRETKAFSTFPRAGNKRNKRSLIAELSARKEVPIENYTTIVISDNGTTEIAMQSDQPMEEMIEIVHQSTSTVAMSDTENIYENNESNVEENTIVHDNDINEMQADQPLEEQIETNESTTTDDDGTVDETKTAEQSDIAQSIIDIITSMTPAMTVPEEIVNKDEKLMSITIPALFVKETQEEITELPVTSMKPSSIEIELSVVQIKNPKDDLPPPEALQQNVTPAEELAPTVVTTETSTNIIETTTHSMKDIKKTKDDKMTKKNSSVKNTNSSYTLLIFMVLHYSI